MSVEPVISRWAVGLSILLLAACDSSADGAGADPVTETTVVTTSTVPEPTTTTSSVTTTVPTTTTVPAPPPSAPPYEAVPSEEHPDLKNLAARMAESLTTYDASDDYGVIVESLANGSTDDLLEVTAPLSFPARWSRGRVVYPQMGGIPGDRASVMVVTEQTTGTGAEAVGTEVRTLDVRLVDQDGEWVFDRLASAGGEARDRPDDLAPTAVAVVDDRRIEIPDSARWDIYARNTSPDLLEVMADLAEETAFGVVVLASGHPHHVFETDRVSHHTVGQAVDIYRFGDRMVTDDRGSDSQDRRWVEWLLDDPRVRQVGSPWDLDGASSSRSFTDIAHQDHIHLAVHD